MSTSLYPIVFYTKYMYELTQCVPITREETVLSNWENFISVRQTDRLDITVETDGYICIKQRYVVFQSVSVK
jgi:hypothetical protein